MKRCPQCNRTYTDDALSFCLDDGSPLVRTSAPPSYDASATLQYPQARDTSPPPTIAYPGQTVAQPPAPPPAWSPMPPPQTQKRSPWPWILGIGAVLVFMGIGLIILIFAIASITSENNRKANLANSNTRNVNANAPLANSNRNTNTNANTSSTSTFTDDFSTQRWGTGPSAYGNIWYQNEEYHMHATKDGYIVMYGPDRAEYKTKNATVRVGLRSVDGNPPNHGYGLVVHGERKDGKLEDYAFLIYNGGGPRYKIIDHKGGTQTDLVGWTSASAIRTGTSPNQIEVRIHDLTLDFYINGQFMTSITDSENYKGGVVGFYTSDTGEVAFDDLEITK